MNLFCEIIIIKAISRHPDSDRREQYFWCLKKTDRIRNITSEQFKSSLSDALEEDTSKILKFRIPEDRICHVITSNT